jgi:micrococcal nuclease
LSIKPQVKDRYGRTVAELFMGQENINLRMVQEGSAWTYRRYLKACNSSLYIEAEASAKEKGRGLWDGGNPIAPWEYRKGKRG